MATNPIEGSLPPSDTICASCKRRQVSEPDQLDTSDGAHNLTRKKLKLEDTKPPEPVDNDESLACPDIVSVKEFKKSHRDMSGDQPRESAEDELQRLRKEWTSPIYAFFKSSPTIQHIGSRRVHVFECLAKNCKAKGKNPGFVNRYLDKADARSTSNLRKHVKICWGTDIVAAADKIKDLDAIRAVVGKADLTDGSLVTAFEGMGKGKLTYILSLPENAESR